MGIKGYLILENGDILEGESFGAKTEVDGEVVFNTGMVGYPEGFTDPSYFRQILVMTYPLIGNYGAPPKLYTDNLPKFLESEKIQIKGLIVSSYIENNTHWQSAYSLSSWLYNEGIPALSGIDTRTLTKILRSFGVMKGKISFTKPRSTSGFIFDDINSRNLVSSVSIKEPKIYGNGKIRLVLIDCGFKSNQIKLLLKHDTTIIHVPWSYDLFGQGNRYHFDAIFISNGPGDPKMVKETIETIKQAIGRKIPILGICLGNQILALATGADTFKLKYGHRSQNQPVKDEISGKCYVTSQNHGFAVDTKSLREDWIPWFTNLNDNTNEGIRHMSLPFFSIQFHPEATPGPTDTEWIFPFFIEEVKKWLKKN